MAWHIFLFVSPSYVVSIIDSLVFLWFRSNGPSLCQIFSQKNLLLGWPVLHSNQLDWVFLQAIWPYIDSPSVLRAQRRCCRGTKIFYPWDFLMTNRDTPNYEDLSSCPKASFRKADVIYRERSQTIGWWSRGHADGVVTPVFCRINWTDAFLSSCSFCFLPLLFIVRVIQPFLLSFGTSPMEKDEITLDVLDPICFVPFMDDRPYVIYPYSLLISSSPISFILFPLLSQTFPFQSSWTMQISNHFKFNVFSPMHFIVLASFFSLILVTLSWRFFLVCWWEWDRDYRKSPRWGWWAMF